MLHAGKLHVNAGILHTKSNSNKQHCITNTLNFDMSVYSQVINVNSLKKEKGAVMLQNWAFATH